LEKKKIILIDGNSLVYRAFYALPTTLATSAGQITNAVYGFSSMLIKLLREEKPNVVLVAFDKGMPARVAQYEEYKAHRPETPDELRSQMPLVKEVLEVLNIPIFEMEGCEADDILATLAKKAEREGHQVLIVTADRDAFQLVSPRVKIMTTKRGISDIVLYDHKAVISRYGVPPERIVDYLALKGDSSDNIPGVPSIGEKTAAKLIQEFGGLENILENVDRIPAKNREALKNYAEQAKLSKQLAILDCGVPIDVDFDRYRLGGWDERRVREVFSSLEFNTLLERLLTQEVAAPAETPLKIEIKIVLNEMDLKDLLKQLDSSRRFGLEIVSSGTHPIDLNLTGLSVSTEDETYYIPLEEKLGQLPKALVFGELKSYLESLRKLKVVHEGKTLIHCLRNEGINLNGLSFDTLIAAYLLDPKREVYPLEHLCRQYLRLKIAEEETEEGVGQKAFTVLKLQPILERELKEKELWELFEEIEMPLLFVLAKMELEGVGIERQVLEFFSSEVEDTIKTLEREIYDLAGEEFNINSSQQLGTILFEKLRLEPHRRTKTGYSTDYSVLIKLVDQHPIIEKLLQYRELSKLKSTYIDALPKLVHPRTKRLHTTFSQTITTTGRLTSSNPNLQNIPIRTELGLRIREAFIPTRPSDQFLVADYSQIELRILAHLSQDQGLLRAFREKRDIHLATACEVFGVRPEDVDPLMRRAAKGVNFGVVYGISPYGLSEQLGISKDEAKAYIDRYFERYPSVREFIDKVIADAYRDGYVKTLMNRRRYLPELKSSNYRIRNFGERLAINTTIQGSAADIIKLAMIQLEREFGERGLRTRMVLQVHDELIFEVPEDERKAAQILVREVMENAYPLDAKLKVDISMGPNWKEAKE